MAVDIIPTTQKVGSHDRELILALTEIQNIFFLTMRLVIISRPILFFFSSNLIADTVTIAGARLVGPIPTRF